MVSIRFGALETVTGFIGIMMAHDFDGQTWKKETIELSMSLGFRSRASRDWHRWATHSSVRTDCRDTTHHFWT
ncbi:hypothetical protein CC2G_012548 [Coprinopsis cinerea AmutBmut pab1-1]|nr:hypothetical protein CC2G_012548 [Coprinopsis cinerea AmutBmut pab1-1]